MKKIAKLWNSMEKSTRLFIGCFALYMFLYLMLDILEIMLDVQF